VVVAVSLAETTVLFANGSETTSFATLVHGIRDPVDSRVTADSLVVGVDKDDLVVFVHAILIHPVRVQDPQVPASPSYTLLRNTAQTTLELEVIDTLSDGLTVRRTLGNGLLPVSTSDADTVNDISLFRLVSEAAGLVRA